MQAKNGGEFNIYPLAPERWDDLAKLFGLHGADQGCWCMYWRRTPAAFKNSTNAENRQDFHSLVCNRLTHGLLAYSDDQPVGWCSLDPPDELPKLSTSYWRSIDDQPVWSIICFYIDPSYRHRGVATALLSAAIDYAQNREVKILEAYPLIQDSEPFNQAGSYRGTIKMYQDAGFVEVLRRNKLVIMRLYLSS